MKWWDDSMPQPEDWDPAKQLSALKGIETEEHGNGVWQNESAKH